MRKKNVDVTDEVPQLEHHNIKSYTSIFIQYKNIDFEVVHLRVLVLDHDLLWDEHANIFKVLIVGAKTLIMGIIQRKIE